MSDATNAAPEATPTSTGVAEFRAATDTVVENTNEVAQDVTTVTADLGEVAQDVVNVDVPEAVKDGEVTLSDVHALVLSMKRDVDSIKPLIEKAGPALDAVVEEIKAKGVMGLLPAIMSAFRG